MTFDEYVAEWIIRRAVERGLEIISEASKQLPPKLTSLQYDVPWQRVRA
jgi:uncharacterized protein with HEPN domain